MIPGEIYLADIPEAGTHPLVVVSREELNRGRKVLAALITSAKFEARSKLPNCVVLRNGEFGMTKDFVIQCETIAPIPKDAIDSTNGPKSTLSEELFRELIKAIGFVIQSDCEPDF